MKDVPDFRRDSQVLHLWTMFFVYLKLTHVVQWDWVWIFAPIWLGVILRALGHMIMEIKSRKR